MGKLLFPSRSACLGGESEDSRKGIVVGVIVPLPFPTGGVIMGRGMYAYLGYQS